MNVTPRWFESYIVRYLIGTIVGSLCCILLISAVYNPLNTHITLIEGTKQVIDKQLDSTLFLTLSLTGFLYCYISSTPITIIHAARMLGPLPARSGINPSTMWTGWWLILVGALLLAVFFSPAATNQFWTAVGAVAAIPAIYILFAQWAPLAATLDDLGKLEKIPVAMLMHELLNKSYRHGAIKKSQFKRYYRTLASVRTENDDLRSSYSHLREHSNSIFIVLLEISLAALVLTICSLMSDSTWFHRSIAVVILLLTWMTPTVFVWGIANSLEATLVEASENQDSKPLP